MGIEQETTKNNIKKTTAPSESSIIIFSILLIGAIVRLSLLGGHTFSGDESLYASWAMDIFRGKFLFLRNIFLLDKPPVYIIAAGIFSYLVPISEIFAELPNVMADCFSIYLIYKIIFSYYENRSSAYAGAFLYALSPVAILYSASAFTDTFMVMFFLAAFYSLIKGRYFSFGAFYGLSITSKQFAIFYTILFIIYLSAEVLKRKRRIEFAMLIKRSLSGFSIALIIPVFWGIINSLHGGKVWYFWFLGWAGISGQPDTYGLHFSDFVSRLISWLHCYRAIFVNEWVTSIVFLLAAYFVIVKKQVQGLVLLGSLIIYLFLTSISHMPIYDRYIVTFLPVLIIFAAGSLPEIRLKFIWKIIIGLLAAIFFIVSIFTYSVRDSHGNTFGAQYSRNDGLKKIIKFVQDSNSEPVHVYFHRDLSWFPEYYLFHNSSGDAWFNMSGGEDYAGRISRRIAENDAKSYLLFYKDRDDSKMFNFDLKEAMVVKDRFGKENIVLYEVVGDPK